MKKFSVMVAILVLVNFAGICAFSSTNSIKSYILRINKSPISQNEKQDLLHMREEEKLARDVYLSLYKKWRIPIFRNIAKSESWHMQMVKFLLDKYGIEDPVKTDVVGVFSHPHIQELYKELVEKGSKSIVDALKVGATIEDLDIYDLDKAIKRSDNNDIDFVYSRLRWGSTNHLKAFIRLSKRYGSNYTPQYISQVEFNNIINSRDR